MTSPRGGSLIRFLRAHPILCLLILTPGIPEYLSTSSSLTVLVAAPPIFFLFLGFNLALYGPGVLLIREAMVRWRKGWATVLLLGAAYAILEEGIALSTMFNPHAGPVGSLGFYGHYAGVNWVWSVGIVMVHVLFSISVPILLFGFVFPDRRDHPLVTPRQISVVAGILAVDVVLLMAVVWRSEGFFAGAPLLAGSLATMALLIAIARVVPTDLLRAFAGRPTAPPIAFAVLGAILLPGTFLIEGVAQAEHLAPTLAMVMLTAFYLVGLVLALSFIGATCHERQLLGFATGVLGSIAVVGFVASLPVPVVLVGDVALIVFLHRLWAAHPAPAAASSPSARSTPR
ncbi:MAG: hypothetical protein ACREDK_07355 [Thermoplasmata archaeon]